MGQMKPYTEGDRPAAQPEFTKIAKDVAETTFVEGYEASEEEALGIALARHFRWDGIALMKMAAAALEDSNYHAEAAKLDEMIEEAEAE